MSSPPITLDINGTLFTAHPMTLSTSPFFRALLTRWQTNIQPNNTYYIDADPTLFAHLLSYMRRPSRFPLFWTDAAGFDYALYSALEAEANYFGLEALRKWIREARFLDAVKTVTSVRVLDKEGWGKGPVTQEGTDLKVEVMQQEVSGSRRLLTGCVPHVGSGGLRGCRDCEEVLRIGGAMLYGGEEKRVVVVSTRTVVSLEVCENEGGEA
ncbi:hypothetical protein NX059_002717 [Plenodomus lindquistii]|nr:hypothetical protein NX059_002717 [Plenodomus lindquistii]